MNECEKVLVLINDPVQAQELADTLCGSGIKCHAVRNGKDLVKSLLNDKIGLLIIDIDIESENLFSIEKYLIIKQNLSVITVGKSIEDSLALLEIGVDRFLVSPFENSVMIANVHALLRTKNALVRNENVKESAGEVWKLISDGWSLISPDNDVIDLTAREFRFFEILISNQGKIVDKKDLIKHVIGRNYDNASHRLNLMVTRIRKKIQNYQHLEFPIKTEYTVGYSFTSRGVIQ